MISCEYHSHVSKCSRNFTIKYNHIPGMLIRYLYALAPANVVTWHERFGSINYCTTGTQRINFFFNLERKSGHFLWKILKLVSHLIIQCCAQSDKSTLWENNQFPNKQNCHKLFKSHTKSNHNSKLPKKVWHVFTSLISPSSAKWRWWWKEERWAETFFKT